MLLDHHRDLWMPTANGLGDAQPAVKSVKYSIGAG